jgi:class 3 adenylate cyclase
MTRSAIKGMLRLVREADRHRLEPRLFIGEWKLRRVRIGIATGPVIVGDQIGEGTASETAVVGETPNLAARLQALAQPNQIVVSGGHASDARRSLRPR